MADRSRAKVRDGAAADVLTDRERIAAAFVELSERGYLVPFAPWEVCCASCGWGEVRRRFGLSDDDGSGDDSWALGKRVLWWHEQADAAAFAGDPDFLLHTDGFLSRLPDDEHEVELWLAEHSDEAFADTVTARTTKFVDLQSVLQVHWLGDPDEVVAALRVQGLRVLRPDSVDECIAVLPSGSVFDVSVSSGEVLVQLDGAVSLLSVGEARLLAKRLRAAVRAAEVSGLPEL